MEQKHQAVHLVSSSRDSNLLSSLPSADIRRIHLDTNPNSNDIDIKLLLVSYSCHRLADFSY